MSFRNVPLPLCLGSRLWTLSCPRTLNALQVAELDLGPDPEPKQPAAKEEEVKEEAKKAPEAKGLPSLEVKKKGGK